MSFVRKGGGGGRGTGMANHMGYRASRISLTMGHEGRNSDAEEGVCSVGDVRSYAKK